MNEENEDYGFVTVGERHIPIPLLLFATGVILLIVLFIYSNSAEDANTESVLIWVSLFAIGVSIIWTIRKKLIAMAVGFLLLLTIYYISGVALDWFGAEVTYSYGIVTFLVISTFVMWIGLDAKVGWDDAAKATLFAIIGYVINATGWLASVNDVTASYFTGGLPF